MKGALYFIYILIPLFLFPVCNAQDPIKISNPQLEIKDNKIQIDYNLQGSRNSDTYAVRIEVADESGKLINAGSLSGDIGDDVAGGNNKQIQWDYQADSLYIDAEISITVYALLNFVEEPPVAITKIEDPGQTEANVSEAYIWDEFNRTGIVLQSLAFPGLGFIACESKTTLDKRRGRICMCGRVDGILQQG